MNRAVLLATPSYAVLASVISEQQHRELREFRQWCGYAVKRLTEIEIKARRAAS